MPWTATNTEGRPAPAALAVDAVVLRVADRRLEVLALRTEDGRRALPGGLLGPRDDPAEAVRRVLAEKTGLDGIYLEQLAAFADPDRDPRGWIPSIAHLALVPADTTPRDPAARWVTARGRHRWAHDHRDMLALAVDRVEGKLWWSNVAVGLLPAAFTLSQARAVYEGVADTGYDGATFARDLKATGLVEPTGERRSDGPGRPAALYRFVTAAPAWGAGRRKRVSPA
ncbi:NUDIX hydrolase [Paraconexibacter algicola]|uniref:NUDIX hydrolase n=1 Tax=Paraconexibacter algicola TaxID=2133960 RepID=A0A2T4UKD6_9ACTN|nr:NUDIX domain-containing protein [Paraconexibacter algicola]PTL59716.1 NUDIX hydrolase [Paraconexibacter algicola]